MPSTTMPREESFAEYAIRDAIGTVSCSIFNLLWTQERDLAEVLPGERNGELLRDDRREELFNAMFPEVLLPDGTDAPLTPEQRRVSAEAEYMAARILRTIVYNVDDLRREADRLFDRASAQLTLLDAEANGDA